MSDVEVDILVFGAHADDVELSCGGMIARAVSQSQTVGIVDLTRGEMGTRGTPEKRLAESSEAQRILGAAFRKSLDFGDGGLRTGREEELEIISLIRAHRPSIVVAPYPDDRHPDHTRTGRVVTEASFYAGLVKIESGQRPHRPQSVLYYLLNYPIAPSFIVDISAHFETKMRAIAAYESQFYKPGSDEPATLIAKESFLETIKGRSRQYGSLIGADHGEPFVSKNPPRVDDLVAAYQGREVS